MVVVKKKGKLFWICLLWIQFDGWFVCFYFCFCRISFFSFFFSFFLFSFFFFLFLFSLSFPSFFFLFLSNNFNQFKTLALRQCQRELKEAAASTGPAQEDTEDGVAVLLSLFRVYPVADPFLGLEYSDLWFDFFLFFFFFLFIIIFLKRKDFF